MEIAKLKLELSLDIYDAQLSTILKNDFPITVNDIDELYIKNGITNIDDLVKLLMENFFKRLTLHNSFQNYRNHFEKYYHSIHREMKINSIIDSN